MKIKVKSPTAKRLISSADAICQYSGQRFGLNGYGNGSNVKIAIIGTGSPKHSALKNIKSQNFNQITIYKGDDLDRNGLSTYITGILCGKKNKFKGIVTQSQILLANVVDENSQTDFKQISSAILWAAINSADIIFLPFAFEYNQNIFLSLKTAYQKGCCIVSVSPVNQSLNDWMSQSGFILMAGVQRDVQLNNYVKIKQSEQMVTTMNNRFCRASGALLAGSVCVGLLSLMIQKNKHNKKENVPKQLYSNIVRMFNSQPFKE